MSKKLQPSTLLTVHTLGTNVWPHHLNKEFVYQDASTNQDARVEYNYTDEIPTCPVARGTIESSKDKILQIQIVGASELLPLGDRPIHAYCRVRLGRKMKRTKPINASGPNPKWGSVMKFVRGSDWAEFEVWDKHPLGSDTLVGAAEFNVQTFISSGKGQDELTLQLMRKKNKIPIKSGMLQISLYLSEQTESEGEDGEDSDRIRTCNIHLSRYENLDQPEKGEVLNPYFIFHIGLHKEKTQVVRRAKPTGSANITCGVDYYNEPKLRVEAWNHNTVTDDTLIGHGSIDLKSFKTGLVELLRFNERAQADLPAGRVELNISVS